MRDPLAVCLTSHHLRLNIRSSCTLKMHHDIIAIWGDSKFTGETMILIQMGGGARGPPLRQSYSLLWVLPL